MLECSDEDGRRVSYVNARACGNDKNTALHEAAAALSTYMCLLLITRDPSLLSVKGNGGKKPSDFAREKKSEEAETLAALLDKLEKLRPDALTRAIDREIRKLDGHPEAKRTIADIRQLKQDSKVVGRKRSQASTSSTSTMWRRSKRPRDNSTASTSSVSYAPSR